VDEAGVALPERSLGEILFRGPSVAAGYYSDPQNSCLAFESGWLRTGDLGYVLNGELYIVGRKKDLVIIKGRNYDPQRIEWIAEEVPAVRKGSAVAFSRPGVDSEELVVVAESRNREGGITAEAIRQRINEQMQLVAADVVLLEPGSLPKTSSGKLQRRKTRAQYLAGGLGAEGVRSMGATAQTLVLAKHVAISLVGRGRHFVRGLLRRSTMRLRQSGEPVD
jgi:fatty-acyl-CoA synthase